MGKSKEKTFKVFLAALMSVSSLGITPVAAEDDYASEVNLEETESVDVAAAPEVVDPNITYVESATDFAEAIYVAPEETDTRIMLPSSVDLTEILSDTTYSGVTYDDVSVIDFDTVEDKEIATAKIEEAVGNENLSKNEVMFYLDSNEDFGSEVDLSSEEPSETEVVTVEREIEEEPKAIVEIVSSEDEQPKEIVETAELVEEDPKEIIEEEPKELDEEEPKEIVEEEEETLPVSTLWQRAETEGKPIIAVIDTGVNNYADESVDLTGSGTTEDIHGHGTQMAKIIREEAGDDVLILSIKAFTPDGASTSSTMYAAVKYAMEAGADIINISASANDSEDAVAFKSVVMQAMSIGITVVGSAGNSGIDAAHRIPANIDGVIGVTTLDDDGEIITGNYGIYADYGVTVSSSSEATAVVSALIAVNKLEERLGKDVYEIDSEGEVATYPVDEESYWTVDCSSVLYVRSVIQQPDGSYVGGTYSTTNGLSSGAQVATFRVYGAKPTWWEDGNTSKAQGGINSSGRTWFYMDNEGSGAYDTNSPEFNHIASSRPYYGQSQYSIYHSWAKGIILGNFQVDSINVTNANYKYMGFHIEYYDNDGQLGGCTNSMTEAQAAAKAASSNSFYYRDPDNVGSPARAYGSPTALKTGSVTASFSKSAAAGGTASYNSTNYRNSNSWKRIHVTLVFALKSEPMPYRINKTWVGDTGLEGFRPSALTLHIKGSDGSNTTASLPVTQSGTTHSTTVTLPSKTNAGAAITYKVWEDVPENYISSADSEAHAVALTLSGSTYVASITNELAADKYIITKEWTKDTGQTYHRPSSITLHIKGSNGSTRTETLTVSQSGNTFTKEIKLPSRTSSGAAITYKVWEDVPPDYTSSASSEATAVTLVYDSASETYKAKITNELKENGTYKITKAWTSDTDFLSERPSSIKLHIKGSDGQDHVETLTINTSTNTFTKTVNLPQRTSAGQPITYKVWEEKPNNYKTTNSTEATAVNLAFDSATRTYTANLSNSLETAKYKIIKVWAEDHGDEISRPSSVTLHLKGSDGTLRNITLPVNTTRDEFSTDVYTLPSMSKTSGPITYKVWEDEVEDYTTDNADEASAAVLEFDSATNTYIATVTNTLVRDFPVQKTVTDANNTDINTKVVSVGANLYYHITFENPYSRSRNFDITDTLPANTEFVSADNGGVLNNGNVIWRSVSVEGKTAKTVSFVVKTTTPNVVIPNIASVTIYRTNGTTPDITKETNDVVNYTPDISKAVKNAAGEDINTKSVEPGKVIHYEITVKNPAPEARIFNIRDAIDLSNLEIVSVDNNGVTSDNVVMWVNASIPARSEKVFTIYARVLENKNVEIVNKASLTVELAEAESNEVKNWKGYIDINKSINNYYEHYGTPFFNFKIEDSEGNVWYRNIGLSDDTREDVAETFYIPEGIPNDGRTFQVSELRNARYHLVGVTGDVNMAVANNIGTTVISNAKPNAEISFVNEIELWNKLTHAAEAVNVFGA